MLGVLSLALIVGAGTAYAETRTGDEVTVGADEVINENLYIGGRTITIEGVVNGDVYVGAQTVTVSGEINGDLIVGAETITITGVVNDDIRAAGRALTVGDSALVDNGITFFGEQLSIEEGSEVTGTVIFYGRTLSVDSVVGGDVVGGADDVHLNGSVGGSTYLMADALTVGDSAVIAGDLEYKSPREATIASGATIGGEVDYERVQSGQSDAWSDWQFMLGFQLWSFFSTLIVGLVLLALLPKPTIALSERIRTRPLVTLGVGALVFIATPAVFFILLFSLIGIPLAFLLLATFLMTLYLSGIFVSIALGTLLLGRMQKSEKGPNAYLALIVGMVVMFALLQIPFAGKFLALLVVFFGLGAGIYALRLARRV